MVNVLFDNNAGKLERIGLESKLHHDATNNGQLILYILYKIMAHTSHFAT